MFFYYDPTYILVIIGAVICMAASAHVNSTYRRYAQVRSRSGMTGKDAAERILHANGIYDVTVHHIPGNLTDHYNPANKTLGLSDATYNSASVAAIGVAAHECNPACERVCASSDQRCSGTCCEFRFYGSLAADHYRIIHEWKYSKSADQSRNFAVFGCSAVSDRDIAGRI